MAGIELLLPLEPPLLLPPLLFAPAEPASLPPEFAPPLPLPPELLLPPEALPLAPPLLLLPPDVVEPPEADPVAPPNAVAPELPPAEEPPLPEAGKSCPLQPASAESSVAVKARVRLVYRGPMFFTKGERQSANRITL